MKFVKRLPSHDLRQLVKFYWVVEDAVPASLEPETVVPDGCMEMIVHFGRPFESVHDARAAVVQPRGFVGGQITRSILIRPTGSIGMLGIRFHPAGARALAKMPMDRAAGETIDVTDLVGAAGRRMVERVCEAATAAGRIAVVEAFLRSLCRDARQPNTLARAAIAALTRSHGRASVRQLAAGLDISERQLNRTLRREVGLGAKSYGRIVRLQYALDRIRHDRDSTLTRIAAAAGYFDQAHFIKDFRSFCGVSPGAFLTQRHALMETIDRG